MRKIPTILLVDDSEVVRKSAARCLRRRGYVVIEAGTADEALTLLAANDGGIDLLLTDLVLPAMGGAELVQEVRRRQPLVGIAYMTGHLGVSARCETALDQTAPILIKPFTPAVLEERVREALVRAGWATHGSSFGAH
jgi:two-component system cell cycle sensor histidine kinase/response regulator CckA